jgi:hypothetical protein
MLRPLWEAIATSKVVTGDNGSDMAAFLTVIDEMNVVGFRDVKIGADDGDVQIESGLSRGMASA